MGRGGEGKGGVSCGRREEGGGDGVGGSEGKEVKVSEDGVTLVSVSQMT